MRLTRIHIETPLTRGSLVELPKDSGAHLAKVLRARAGDELVLFNGDGQDYAAVIERVQGSRVTAAVGAGRPVATESPLHITLVQSVARGEKMDFVVQKATELGVTRIVPVLSQRGVVRLDAAQGESKRQHWQAVAVSACEQCGRSRVPVVAAPRALLGFLGDTAREAQRFVLEPPEVATAPRLPDADRQSLTFELAIGPEGGFEAAELEAFELAGFKRLALGPRILRTETAALAALVWMQTIMGDMSAGSDDPSL